MRVNLAGRRFQQPGERCAGRPVFYRDSAFCEERQCCWKRGHEILHETGKI
jgi:hypothetical protein